MKLKTIIETCAEPIVVYDKQGRTTYVNPCFERVFGWKKQEIIGSRIDFVPEDQIELTKKSVVEVLAGNTISGMETQRKTKNGETIHVRLSAAPIKDEQNNFEGLVVTLQDISDLVRSRRQALAADQAKSEFFSNISHEVRTPMNHVMGMIELLLNTRLDAKQQEFMEILQTSADSLMMTINDMLDYSKIESGEVGCDAIGFDLRTLVEKVAHLMAPKAAEKGLAFDLLVHQFVPSLLMGDPGRLRQILVNLCSNAIKFTKHGGVKMNIFLEKENDTAAKIRFEVSDTGIGIAPDQTRMIFDSFSQADGSATRKHGGTGLGLSIASKLVQMMGSTIDVKSLPGRGACFSFILSFEKQAPGIGKKMGVPIAFQGKKILVVDENIMDRRVLKTLILDWGCSFDGTSTAQEALEKLNASKDRLCCDVILLNLELPGGEALAKEIKTFPWARGLVIIILASMGKKGDVVRLKKIGVNGYLPKPIKPQELYDCIATAFTAGRLGQDEMITRHTLTENRKQQVKILLVEAGRVNRKIILNILGKSGYSANSKTDMDGVFETFKTEKFNLVLLDIDLPGSLKLLNTIRQHETQEKKKRVPVIAMTDGPMENEIQKGFQGYVEDCLLKPVTPEKLLASIETWTWQNEAFLRAHVGGYSRMNSQKNQTIVFNLKAALKRAMDDKAFLEMLVTEFMASLSAKIAAIKKAAREKDSGAVIVAAQSLKGSSANMGADMIKAAAQAIENMGEEGDLSRVDNRISRLQNESERFKAHVTTIKWSEV
jgi:PAS domain S-box-containing protein